MNSRLAPQLPERFASLVRGVAEWEGPLWTQHAVNVVRDPRFEPFAARMTNATGVVYDLSVYTMLYSRTFIAYPRRHITILDDPGGYCFNMGDVFTDCPDESDEFQKLAIFFYSESAELHLHPRAQLRLANKYQDGAGVTKNTHEAARLCSLAIDSGMSGADAAMSRIRRCCACAATPARKLCSGCSLARYCSVDCQRSHRAAHKQQCFNVV